MEIVMCLLHEHENPSFIPSLLWRLRLVVSTCNPSSGYICISQLNGSFSSGHAFSTDRHCCPLSYKHSGELKALLFLPYGKFIYSTDSSSIIVIVYSLVEIHLKDCFLLGWEPPVWGKTIYNSCTAPLGIVQKDFLALLLWNVNSEPWLL